MTKIYRKAIDNYFEGKELFTKEDIIDMKKIFNREFTKGFIFKEKNDNFVNQFRPNHFGIQIGEVIGKNKIRLRSDISQGDGIRIIGKHDVGTILNKIYKNGKLVNKAFKGDIISIDLKENVNDGIVVLTSDKKQLEKLQTEIKNTKKIKVDLYVETIKDKLIIKLNDGINEVELEDKIVFKATGSGTSKERIISQLKKINDTPFAIDKVQEKIDDNIFIKIKDLNDIKRKIIKLLEEKRCYKIAYKKDNYSIELPDFDVKNSYSVLIKSIEDYELIKDKNVDNIYALDDIYSRIKDDRMVKRLPRVNFDLHNEKCKLLIGDFGSLYKYKDVITDFNFNVTNSYAVAILHFLGVQKVTLSYELKYSQVKRLVKNYKERYHKNPNLEVIISSYPEAMISKFDLLKYYKIKKGYLKDNFNNKFKVESKNGIMTIYNFKKIVLEDDYFNIGVNSLRVHIEDREDIKVLPIN